MGLPLTIHIAAGMLGLIAGAIALSTLKGARVHRKSGMVFVYAMLMMSLAGAAIAAVHGGMSASVNVPAGLTTAYLVVTGLTTVKSPSAWRRRVNLAAMLVGLAVGLSSLTFAFASNRPRGMEVPLVMFGAAGLLGSAGDLRMMRSGDLRGPRRLARHLWRMCLALFIAAGSFFLGQADEFPPAPRIPGLLALPVLAVLVAMLYWLRRVRVRTQWAG